MMCYYYNILLSFSIIHNQSASYLFLSVYKRTAVITQVEPIFIIEEGLCSISSIYKYLNGILVDMCFSYLQNETICNKREILVL